MQIDKALHFGAGFLITLAVGFLVQYHSALPQGMIAGLVACILVAWFKEERDSEDPANHTRDGWDAYATVCGAAPAFALMLLWPKLLT